MRSQILVDCEKGHPFALTVVLSAGTKEPPSSPHPKRPSTTQAFPIARAGHKTNLVFQSCRNSRPGTLLSRLYQAGSDQDVCAACAIAPQGQDTSGQVSSGIPSPQTAIQECRIDEAAVKDASAVLRGLLNMMLPNATITAQDGTIIYSAPEVR